MQPRLNTLRTFRLLTVATVLLAFAGQGLAAAGHVRSCQLQMAHAQLSAEQHEAIAGDCCPSDAKPNAACDLGGKSQLPGKDDPCSACKAGYNCKSPQTFEPSRIVLTLAMPTHLAVSAPPLTQFPSHSPDGLWRPPARI